MVVNTALGCGCQHRFGLWLLIPFWAVFVNTVLGCGCQHRFGLWLSTPFWAVVVKTILGCGCQSRFGLWLSKPFLAVVVNTVLGCGGQNRFGLWLSKPFWAVVVKTFLGSGGQHRFGLWLSKPVGVLFWGFRCTTHFGASFSGWIGRFTGGTIWILTHGHISGWSLKGSQKGSHLIVVLGLWSIVFDTILRRGCDLEKWVHSQGHKRRSPF